MAEFSAPFWDLAFAVAAFFFHFSMLTKKQDIATLYLIETDVFLGHVGGVTVHLEKFVVKRKQVLVCSPAGRGLCCDLGLETLGGEEGVA